MYVKEEKNTIYFRLWNADDEPLWNEHGWVPYEAIKQAADMYDEKTANNAFNPHKAYDINIAKALIKETD